MQWSKCPEYDNKDELNSPNNVINKRQLVFSKRSIFNNQSMNCKVCAPKHIWQFYTNPLGEFLFAKSDGI